MTKQQIPKIIHYCWFGGNSLPELAQKCIASWKQFFPDYEIKEWNESNYDVHKIPYTSEAYNAKKYAFVSDYARFDVLYEYGGIYFDTDVEVIKPFDNILQNGGFMGLESVGNVAAGLGIGCNAGLGIVYQILEFYAALHFLNKDGSYNLQTVVKHVTKILLKNGLKKENIIQVLEGLVIYPIDYFNPMAIQDGELKITENTYSIHHFAASWHSEKDKRYQKYGTKIISYFGSNYFSKFIIRFIFVIRHFKEDGIPGALKYYVKRLKSEF
jgi:mannosyltransferase OCH1-like enzyme